MNESVLYDIAVIGAGPAGVMAAIRGAELDKKVLLIEKNESIGNKMLITGKGRCNITNSADVDVFIEKFGDSGEFLRTAFYKFFNTDLVNFFAAKGLELKTERQGRVFPVTDKAKSIVEVLKECLHNKLIDLRCGLRLKSLEKDNDLFKLNTDTLGCFRAYKVILATGGASYKATGSTGDGYVIAGSLGHTVSELSPGLVPLKVNQVWVKDLQGLSLKNVSLVFVYGNNKKILSDIGEVMFTHFGISGPLVLDLSQKIVSILKRENAIKLFIDLKPGLRHEQLEAKLLHKFKIKGDVMMKNIMKDLLPQRLISVFLKVFGLGYLTKTNQITQDQRKSIIMGLKAFPLTVSGSLCLEEAMVTVGGVSTKEINPRTMESKLIKGLYFAGEIIDGAAPSGGYNLQQAFSTGYLAGEKAANA